jgi:uncharacterized membrane protein
MSLLTNLKGAPRVRYLLLGSLALNLVLAGAAGAVAFQHSSSAATPKPIAGIKRGIESHLAQIAASLPADDARIMRAELRADALRLATAQTEVRLSEEAVRNSLRAEPFDPAAVRNAMAEDNQARDRFFRLVHDAVASATAKMSPDGRKAIADWPVKRFNTVVTQ